MRRIIKKELLDVATWPEVSVTGLNAERAEVTLRRAGAIIAYLGGSSLREIEHRFNIKKNKVLRLFNRCISAHEDGRIWGFRACLKYKRMAPYNRSAQSTACTKVSDSGYSGLMRAIFERFPHILEDVIERALRNRNKHCSESSIRMDRLHARFIHLCRSAGIANNEYPFNVKSLGERSFRNVIKKEIFKRNLRAAVAATYGDDAARKLGSDAPSPRIGAKNQCYERVELDGHRIDIHTIIELPDPKGGEPLVLPLERVWILVALDTCSRAVLGYSISLNRHYTSEDVLICLENAIRPWKQKVLTIPGLVYPEGSGLPSGVIEGLEYAKFSELAIDNDKSHLAAWVFDRVRTEIGCAINPGPVKTPDSRQYVERFFRSFEQMGFQRLPSTTGSGPSDPKRRDPEYKATKHKIRLDEILELVDVIIATYNITPHSGLSGRSPIEYLRFAFDRQSFFVRTIPEEKRSAFSLTREMKIVEVRAYLDQGVRPFVEILGVRYYGQRLNNSVGLLGKKLHVEIQTQDMRTVKAFLPDGQEFEVLTVARAWAGTKHDLQTRKAIQRENRSRRLEGKSLPDAVETYIEFKKNEKKRNKKTNNQIARTINIKTKSGEIAPALAKPARRRRSEPKHKISMVHLTGVNY